MTKGTFTVPKTSKRDFLNLKGMERKCENSPKMYNEIFNENASSFKPMNERLYLYNFINQQFFNNNINIYRNVL